MEGLGRETWKYWYLRRYREGGQRSQRLRPWVGWAGEGAGLLQWRWQPVGERLLEWREMRGRCRRSFPDPLGARAVLEAAIEEHAVMGNGP